jgi:hypothetical protein
MKFAGLEQALQQLKEKLPIERARMRLKLQIPVTCRNDLMQLLASQQARTESEDLGLHNSQVTPTSCLRRFARAGVKKAR